MIGRKHDITNILNKSTGSSSLTDEEIIYLLSLEDQCEIEELFSAARTIRVANFGKSIFLYGFIYFSTYCRNNCTFCFYRSSNTVSERYRKSHKEIIETAEKLTKSGVHLLDLTMGEDPFYFKEEHFEDLLNTIASIKEISGLPMMISPGVVPRPVLDKFYDLGVSWYACYQETHNRQLYDELRLNQDYDERLELKKYARRKGLLIEEGLLAGIGESAEDICHSFRVMEELSADQVRVMSFVPQKGTPLENQPSIPRIRELLMIAVMRLIFPDRLIPASLDVDGLSGLKKRLDAGANVITSIIPPGDGLLGVSQSTLDIQEGGRSVKGIKPVLQECGLEIASKNDYKNWIKNRLLYFTDIE